MTKPLDYPEVKIGERVYVLKYSLLAKYHLSRQKISESDLLNALAEFERCAIAAVNAGQKTFLIPAGWLAAVIDAWSACVAHMYSGVGEKPPTSDQWAAALESEFEKTPSLPVDLFRALQTAIVKVPRPSEAAPVAAETAAPLN